MIDVLSQTLKWHQTGNPVPTDELKRIALGVHTEEFGEMLEELYISKFKSTTSQTLKHVQTLAEKLKTKPEASVEVANPVKLLDAMIDQIVTAVGVCHAYGFDVIGALNEVNRSNFSKYDPDGAGGYIVYRNEHGKLTKGPNYSKPNLEPFLPKQG